MGRPKAPYPAPSKRQQGSRWQVYWSAEGKRYSVNVDAHSEEEAEGARMEVALALSGLHAWPQWTSEAKGVQRYLDALANVTPHDGVLDQYQHANAHVEERWRGNNLYYLQALQAFTGKPLAHVTARDADDFLAAIMTTASPRYPTLQGRSAATRNRYRTACLGFYRWAVATGRMRINPFADTRVVKVHDPEEIAYCTPAERDEVLAAADRLPDRLAVWLAFYAGMRRGEIARCAWRDVHVGRIVVPRSKTGKRRQIPLAAVLAEQLKGASQRAPRIVPWPESYGRWNDAATRCTDALRVACPDIPPERIRWNAFRHTFGTLLAQAGVTLDKISAWMGNSPEICRRHYAQFVPRDRRDEEIDLL